MWTGLTTESLKTLNHSSVSLLVSCIIHEYEVHIHNVLADFLEELRGLRKRYNSEIPILVHCSAGVGRSGVVVLMDRLMGLVDSGEVCFHMLACTLTLLNEQVEPAPDSPLFYFCIIYNIDGFVRIKKIEDFL